jgi:hypothetical protein
LDVVVDAGYSRDAVALNELEDDRRQLLRLIGGSLIEKQAHAANVIDGHTAVRRSTSLPVQVTARILSIERARALIQGSYGNDEGSVGYHIDLVYDKKRWQIKSVKQVWVT